MKNLIAKMGLLAFLSLIPSVFINAKVQDEKEPIAFTVVMFEDGTTLIFPGELTDAQIRNEYVKHGDIEAPKNTDVQNN